MRTPNLRWILFLLPFLAMPCARAATEQFYILTITNVPAGLSSNLVINMGTADTRSPTNDTSGTLSTTWQVTNTIPWAVSNLFIHLGNYPAYTAGAGTPQLSVLYTNTDGLLLIAPLNTNLTVSVGAGWASLVKWTNQLSDANPILTPTNNMSARVRTNAANALVNLLSAPGIETTNSIATNKTAMRNYVDISTPGQVVSNKTITHTIVAFPNKIIGNTNFEGTNVNITNVTAYIVTISGAQSISGFAGSLTNGNFYSNLLAFVTATNPIILNGINYGNAFRSEGPGSNSFQMGSNATASGFQSLAVGNSATASSGGSMAIGNGATASTSSSAMAIGATATATATGIAIGNSSTVSGSSGSAVGISATASASLATAFGYNSAASGQNSTAIGPSSQARADGATALGYLSVATNQQATAIGQGATATNNSSTAIGYNAATTAPNQIMLGTSTETVAIPGLVTAATATNSILKGINTLNGRLDLTPRANSGLVNGLNSGIVLGTNVYIRISGPSGAYTNAGFAAEVDGSYHIIQFNNPVINMTIMNNSGLEATPANRILTGTGGDLNFTNGPVFINALYDATAAGGVGAWRLVNWTR
jgi:trimeric autotransporter adhesin